MSARDDYPKLAKKADNPRVWFSGVECGVALDEIDRLRRWKAEALPLLELLDRCHGLLPFDAQAPLGYSKAEAVERFLRLRLGRNRKHSSDEERYLIAASEHMRSDDEVMARGRDPKVTTEVTP